MLTFCYDHRMGLRQTQKSNRRRAILAAAQQLFLQKGFEQSKAEEIAELAEVSLGTLYNYFSGKGEILLTLVTEESERIHEFNRTLVRNPTGTAADALSALLGEYFDPKHVTLNRDLWRLGIALSFSDPTTDVAREFRDLDRKLCDQVVELVENLRKAGEIRDDVNSEIFGTILFNNANMMFFELNRTRSMTLTELHDRVVDMTAAMVRLVSSQQARPDR